MYVLNTHLKTNSSIFISKYINHPQNRSLLHIRRDAKHLLCWSWWKNEINMIIFHGPLQIW